MSRLSFAGLAFASLALSPSLQAESFESEPMVVTAARTDHADAESLASISIIDRGMIERSQAPDLLELLRTQAGIDIARSGGPGGQTSVFMRGTNSNHVLVLIDGVRVSSAGTGAFTWEILDPALIERIEIVRGPRSARWGSDAIGGVIQIFTRQPHGPAARAAYGRFRDRSLSASWGNESLGVTVAGRRVGGFSAQNERGFAFDPDDDGFEHLSVSARGAESLESGVLSWTARVADGEVEFDQGVSEFLNYSLRGEYRHHSDGPWQWQVSAGIHRDRLDTETPFGFSEAITRRVQSGLQAERMVGEHALWLAGVDVWSESGVSRNSWADSRYNLGAWTGLHDHRGDFDWETSLRIDNDELFGSALTGNLAGGWRPAENWRLFATAARAFRAPNFNQLFSPGFDGLFAGNPDLDPETSISLETGIDWRPATRHRVSLNLFENRIDDLIDFAGEDFRAINIAEARVQGVELRHEYAGAHWHTEAQVTWQDPEDRDSGSQLLRRAQNKASLSGDYRFDHGGWFGGEIVHTGSRPDVGGARLPSYTLVNLRAGWPLAEGFRLEGRLENATDRDYEPLFGFNAHDRSLFVALSWQG